MITVRRATPADRPKIAEFLEKAYQDNARYKFPERWDWQFVNNPYRDVDRLPVWVAVTEDGTVVGQTGVMYEPLVVDGVNYRMAWPLDAYILPEYRGQNLGFETLKANLGAHDLWMGLTMAESSRHILTRLGCRPTDRVPAFARIAVFDAQSAAEALQIRLGERQLGRNLYRVARFLRVEQVLAGAINIRIGVRDLRLPEYLDRSIEIRQTDAFDSSIDELWERVGPQFRVIIRRDSQFLNWKYLRQPFMQYQVLAALRDQVVRGYVIFRKSNPPETNTGIIADLLADPQEPGVIHALLACAVQQLKRQKVKYIYAASTIPEYQQGLRDMGFGMYKTERPLLFCKPGSPAEAAVFESGAWFLGRSDHDWDQFPYA